MPKPIISRSLFKENSLFFISFLAFVLLGALMLLVIETGDTVFFFNGQRSWFWDQFFKYGTKVGEAGIYVVALIILLFAAYRYAIGVPFVGLSVAITAYLLKAYFKHDRPSLYFRKIGMLDELALIEGVRLNGGTNSFPSGHTMSAFAIFTFLALCSTGKKGKGFALFMLAMMVGLSRIYLVQHFFKDVYLGAIIGVSLAFIWYYIARLPNQPFWDKHLVWRKNRRKIA
jgi:membrane-associated phospholipid phosphatase